MATIPETNQDEITPLLSTQDEHSRPNDIDASQCHSEAQAHPLAFKMAAAMYSFALLGLFNSSTGAILPMLSRYFNLTDLHVSYVFLTGPIGYVIAAQASDAIHSRFGQRGIAVLGPALQIVAYALILLHRGFGDVLLAFGVQGLGAGLLDGSWCAWTANMEKANTMSGLLQGSYSIGGAMGSFLVAVITKRWEVWWAWYYVLAVASILELAVLAFAFRHENASIYQRSNQKKAAGGQTDTRTMFGYRATWLCAAYFLTYVGTETATSGWIVSFMLRDRKAIPHVASLASSGYWIGNATGRFILGFPTDWMGVRRATMLYIGLAIMFEGLFSIVSSPIISVALMTLLGFVMGPLYPSGVVVLTLLMPSELHVAAVSFVSSIGQIGAALLPFAIGALVHSLDIGVFRYAIISQTILALVEWCVFSGLRGRSK